MERGSAKRHNSSPFLSLASVFPMPFISSAKLNRKKALNEQKRQKEAFGVILSQVSTVSLQGFVDLVSFMSLLKTNARPQGTTYMTRHLLQAVSFRDRI